MLFRYQDLSIVVPCNEEFKSTTDSIILKFTGRFIDRVNGKTVIKKENTIHRKNNHGRHSIDSKKPKIMDVLNKDKEVKKFEIFF